MRKKKREGEEDGGGGGQVWKRKKKEDSGGCITTSAIGDVYQHVDQRPGGKHRGARHARVWQVLRQEETENVESH